MHQKLKLRIAEKMPTFTSYTISCKSIGALACETSKGIAASSICVTVAAI